MSIGRPRLLVGSLVIALVVSVIGGFIWARSTDDGDVDARLDDASSVVTFPNDGLGNTDVEGDPMPIVMVTDDRGNEVSTASLLGQPLVVNFWFTTCPPCAKELPDFAAVHQERGDEVRFVGMNTLDSIEVMERFASERGVGYELYRDEFAEFTDGIGAVAFPVTIFVTSDGVIVEQTGVLDADGLRDKIDRLLTLEGA